MGNLITRTTELAMSVTLTYIRPGDTVVDATCGAGHDTVALVHAVGDEGVVYAFDIQKTATLLTEARLLQHDITNVRLKMQSFVSMDEYVPENGAAAVVFNLGYLPGGDHSITTTAGTTLKGIECALRIIKPGGIVTVVMYDGHEKGSEEKKAILEWAEKLDQSTYHVAYVSLLNQKNNPPEIVWITKKYV